MKPLSNSSFPKAIMHIDADSFFASVESAKNPKLRGKAVITGHERGIATSMSKEAKALGINRGMPIFQIKKIFPEVIIVPSDYEAYAMYSKRMFEIVKRYTDTIEEYSIDECFADITNKKFSITEYEYILHKIQDEIEKELNISVSLGCAPNKVLAKIGSKYNKPHGITMIPAKLAHIFLSETPINKVWGIGPSFASIMKSKGINTAYDYAILPEEKLITFANKTYIKIWNELNCRESLPLNSSLEKELPKSISRTKSFAPITDKEKLWSELTKNLENACISARRDKLATKYIIWFLKTNNFQFQTYKIKLENPTNIPSIILTKIRKQFDNINIGNIKYRTTGIILNNLSLEECTQNNLFDIDDKTSKQKEIFKIVDKLGDKFGRHIIHLASQINMTVDETENNEEGREQVRFWNKIKKTGKEFSIPYLGETI